MVLIVAKCNVNEERKADLLAESFVLIVAKCNVNFISSALERMQQGY